MPIVEPDEVRRVTAAATDLQDLAHPVDIPDRSAVDMKAVADVRLHEVTSTR
ncbi:MAG TPA: hypothetical protein VFP03_07140 [Jiangellaceae bacterium]|nr:hypothetical protein [Jiangellaceae bacterium]